MRVNSCVYGIQNRRTHKWYVGSTTRRYYRWQDHVRMLRQQRHHAPKLQMSFNKHGEKMFEFIVLEYCGARQLSKAEQRWVNELDAYYNGYNTLPLVKWTDPVAQRERTKKRWAKPGQREEQSARTRKLWLDPLFCKAHAIRTSVAQNKRWREARKNYSPEQLARYKKRKAYESARALSRKS